LKFGFVLNIIFLFIRTALCNCEIVNSERQVSEFVCPGGFYELSDFKLFNCKKFKNDFNPKDVFEGAIIYVKPGLLGKFFLKYHPLIKEKYILITNGGDPESPGEYANYLNDSKIIAWFSRNPSIRFHEKFIPIPIGVNCKFPTNMHRKEIHTMNLVSEEKVEKKHVLYLNIGVQTYPDERQDVYDLFSQKNYCFTSSRVSLSEYLHHIKSSVFILSPRGNGLDCFRTWEAMLMGSIPIVTTSFLDPLFEDLPVVIIDSWQNINKELLLKKFNELKNKSFSFEKLFMGYWQKEINKRLSLAGVSRRVSYFDEECLYENPFAIYQDINICDL